MLSVLLIAPLTARAGHLMFADVAQTVVDVQGGRPRVELRLRNLAQQGGAGPAAGATQQAAGQSSGTTQSTQQAPSNPTGGAASTVTGVEPAQGGTAGQVQVVDLGEVTGTVCDCGPLPAVEVPGGFPLWPLLGLGGIPLFFLGGGENPPDITPTPTPTPPPAPIPEPATLLLFGSSLVALGAGARRRRSRKALAGSVAVAEEV